MPSSHRPLLVIWKLSGKAKLFPWQSCFSLLFIFFVLMKVLRDGEIVKMKVLPILLLRQVLAISIGLMGHSLNSFKLFGRRMSSIRTCMPAAPYWIILKLIQRWTYVVIKLHGFCTWEGFHVSLAFTRWWFEIPNMPFGILSLKIDISFFLGLMVSSYVSTLFWVCFCGCCVMLFCVGCCYKKPDVDWDISWDNFLWILKSTGWDDWSFLFWALSIAIFAICLDFASLITMFFF